MTEFTTIPESDIDPRSPITSTLLVALRDNPIALAEGALSVPTRIQTGALEQANPIQAVSTATLRDFSVTDPKFANLSIDATKIAADVSTTLVTNGPAHTHTVGDGAQIPFNGLRPGLGWVGNDVVTTIGSTGSILIGAGASWVPVAGWYNVSTIIGVYLLELFIAGAWRSSGDPFNVHSFIWTDGTNVRVRAVSDPFGFTIEFERMAI